MENNNDNNNNDNNIGKHDYILFLENKVRGKKERYKQYNVKRDEILRKKIHKWGKGFWD